MSWLKVFVVISILTSGCGQGVQQIEVEECEIPETNLDSLFSIADSALASLYIQQAEQRLYTDELAEKLTEKQIQEERERIIYKDTIIYRDTVIYQEQVEVVLKTITDTIYDIVTIYVTDTVDVIVDAKKKRKKKENQE